MIGIKVIGKTRKVIFNKKNIIVLFYLFFWPVILNAQFIRNGEMYSINTGWDNPPDYWGDCGEESTPDLDTVFENNGREYFSPDSSTFCALKVRDSTDSNPFQRNKTENIYTELLQPLTKGNCYHFSGLFRHTYDGREGDSTYFVRLQLWGGKEPCLVENDEENFELLFESDTISTSEWKRYNFYFDVKNDDYNYFYIRPYWDTINVFPHKYNGVVFLEDLDLQYVKPVDPPIIDTLEYYYSTEMLLKFNAIDGYSYLWEPSEALSYIDYQSAYLVDYVDTLSVTVFNEESCPLNFKYGITYHCDSVYKKLIHREEEIYLRPGQQLFLNATLGNKHKWSPGIYLSNDTVSNPLFDNTAEFLTDTLTYTDSIEDYYGCEFSEAFHIIHQCDTIRKYLPQKGTTNIFYRPDETIVLETTRGVNHIWFPDDRLTFIDDNIAEFTGYNGNIEDTITYNVLITDDYGCEFTEKLNIILDCEIIYPSEEPINMLDTVVDKLSSFLFEPKGFPIGVWNPPDGLSCFDCQNPIATPTSSQRYTIKLVDELGCERTEEYKIDVSIYIPNVITPNDDKLNDEFIILGLPQGSTINIFNKEGLLIYSNENYGNKEWWKGTKSDGNHVTTGTYWYVLEIPGQEVKKGFIFVKH